MANVPMHRSAGGPPASIDNSPARRELPAFDEIAPAAPSPGPVLASPIERPMPPPGEWFAFIFLHRCHDDVFVEVYPTEREADEAAERFKASKLQGHDAETYSDLSGCGVEMFVVPAYLHGLTATVRSWPRLDLNHR